MACVFVVLFLVLVSVKDLLVGMEGSIFLVVYSLSFDGDLASPAEDSLSVEVSFAAEDLPFVEDSLFEVDLASVEVSFAAGDSLSAAEDSLAEDSSFVAEHSLPSGEDSSYSGSIVSTPQVESRSLPRSFATYP